MSKHATDDGLGCRAFGHLASPFVDAELPRHEMDRFEVHLGGCEPCRRLTEDFRAIDAGTRAPYPEPSREDWGRAWEAISTAAADGREAEARAPLAPVTRFARRVASRRLPARVRPLAYLAASLLLVFGLEMVRRASQGDSADASFAGDAVEITSLECEAEGYVPMKYTIGDDDPIVVAQCVYVGRGS